jgi:hypothetical protein
MEKLYYYVLLLFDKHRRPIYKESDAAFFACYIVMTLLSPCIIFLYLIAEAIMYGFLKSHLNMLFFVIYAISYILIYTKKYNNFETEARIRKRFKEYPNPSLSKMIVSLSLAMLLPILFIFGLAYLVINRGLYEILEKLLG